MPIDLTIDRDLVFAETPHGDLLLDLYRPMSDAPVPVVMWLHGGGWFTGDRTLAPDLAAFARTTGMAVASIEYRLSGQALFPAQLFDVRSAIRFLRSQSARLGLDAEAIGVWGSSAGGHLALLAGLLGHRHVLDGEDFPEAEVFAGDASVQAVSAGYPPTDLTLVPDGSTTSLPGVDPFTTPESRLIGGQPDEIPEAARRASPLVWASTAPRGAPPIQLVHGTADSLVAHRHSELLHKELTRAGVYSELYLIEGYMHGFLNPHGRLDVQLAAVMDDGRLALEGPVHARLSTPSNQEEANFGFETVAAFFRRHLLASITSATTNTATATIAPNGE